jgi:hypothetical protein
LATLIPVLLRNPGLSAAYGLPQDVDESLAGTERLRDAFGYRRPVIDGWAMRWLPCSAPTTFASLVIWDVIETPGQVLIRRSCLRQIGEWKTMPSEDWDIWLRLSVLGPLEMVPSFTMRKRRVAGLSSDGRWLATAEPMVRRMLMDRIVFSAEQRRTARLGHLWSCAYRASWALDPLRHGKPIEAARQLARAARSFGRFLLVAPRY